MLKWICWSLLFACPTVLAEPATPGDVPLTIYTEDSPPHNFPTPTSGINTQSTITGISTEIVRELMQRTHIEYSITLLPWAEAYARAQYRPNTCVYSTTMTYRRRPLFKWIGPLTQTQWILVAARGSTIQLNTLDDAKKYSIGVNTGGVQESYFQDQGGFRLEPSESDIVNIGKLQSGRIDLWATGTIYFNWDRKRLGLSDALHEVLQFHEPTWYGLACNLDTPDAVIKSLNGALKSMHYDGTRDRIEAKFVD